MTSAATPPNAPSHRRKSSPRSSTALAWTWTHTCRVRPAGRSRWSISARNRFGSCCKTATKCMASDKEIILRMTEKVAGSIYMPFWIRSKREQQIRAMIEDPEVDLSVKFTGVLAILAQLQFPIQLSDFRSAIPLHFWSSQVQFHYTSMLGGSVPIFTEFGKEWFYRMNVGKAR